MQGPLPPRRRGGQPGAPHPAAAAATWALAAVLLAAGGCAKQGRPPGGPVDRTAPTVVAHRPAADATGVARDQAIVVEFSEAMDRARTEEAVFLAPRSDFDVEWSGRRLRIRVRGGLTGNRTYVATVGTDARDLRGNRLAQSFQLPFATGARLDEGTLAGSVVSADHEPVSGAFVWAYDMELFDGRAGVEPPAYVTQSGADGGFRFERLAGSRYRTIAFRDGNRNQRPDGGEPVGLPHADVVADAEGEADGGILVLTPPERAPRVQRISAVDRRRVLLVFDGAVEAPHVEVRLQGLSVEGRYAAPDDASRLYLVTGLQEPGRTYRAAVTYAGRPVEVPGEPARGTERADRRPPALVAVRPAGDQVQADSLRLTFSEPMDTSRVPATADWVVTDSTAAPPVSWGWVGPMTLTGALQTPLPPGPQHLVLRLQSLADAAGNAPADSTALWTFDLLGPEAHGAVAGSAGWDAEIGPVHVVLAAAGRPARTVPADASGRFAFDAVAPGAYRLYAFVDVDGDGRRGAGRLDPFAHAEPLRLRRDVTVERGQQLTIDLVTNGPDGSSTEVGSP